MIDDYSYPELEIGDQDWRWAHEYPRRVLSGEIVAGEHIINACRRHFNDLENPDYYFDEDAARSVVLWFKFIPITDGKNVGKPTRLGPWQIWVVASLMAWKHKDTGLRRFKYAYIQVGRKNGKSTIAGGLSLYVMYKSGYFRPRVYSVATKKDQAKELWSAAHTMVTLSPRLRRIFEPRANDILYPAKVGEFKPLASDSNTLDGKNPLMVNLDECHAIKDRNLYGVMVSAFGAQDEPLMLTITTAGTVLDGICTDLNKAGKRVVSGDKEFESYFYAIYEIDDGDDWEDPECWEKANPGMSSGIPSVAYLKDRLLEAKDSLEEKANFLTKHCNLFVSGADKWLDIQEVKACRIDIDQLELQDRKCYAAIDRSRVNDLTSFCLLFPDPDGGATCIWKNLLPRRTMERATDYLKSQYRKAIEHGSLQLVETPTIKDAQIKAVIRQLFDKYDIEMMGYDPWKMTEIAIDMGEGDEETLGEGYPMVAVSQGTGNMSEPARKWEGLIADRTFKYDDPLLEFSATCAIAKYTDQNNLKIVRDDPRVDKIDPIISGIIALSCATLQTVDDNNVYESRGLLWVG